MSRRSLAGACLIALTTLVGCPTGYEFKRIPGQVHVNTAAVIARLSEQAEKSCREGLRPYVHCETEPDKNLCASDPITYRPVPPAICGSLEPLLTFVHSSDAQLKEDQISMDGPLGVTAYDHINGASQRNPSSSGTTFAVLLATMLGVNSLADQIGRQPDEPESEKLGRLAEWKAEQAKIYAPCAPPLPPSFVLHTGDAIDSGMFSELFEFLTIMRRLRVPFFNAVGNHDNLFFGTFPKGAMHGVDVTLPFVPLGDTDRFLRSHDPDATEGDFSIPYSAQVNDQTTTRDWHTTVPAKGTPPAPYYGSNFFGFDLYCPNAGSMSGQALAKWKLLEGDTPAPSFPAYEGHLCADARGYYGQDFLLPAVPGPDGKPRKQRKIRLLVLNTAEIGPETLTQALQRRSQGNMREEQYLWLERELKGHRDTNTLFFVSGHHHLNGFWGDQDGRLQKLLVNTPRVIAYLSGHTHRDAIRRFDRTQGKEPLWEVTAGSTLVYPQFAHLIDLLSGPKDELYVRVRSFRQRVSDVFCSSDCDLKYLAARGRVGAYNDVHDQDFRRENDTKRDSNGLFRVSGFPDDKENER